MSVVTVTPLNVRQYGEMHGCVSEPYIAGEEIANGQWVYQHTDGTVLVADANVAGKQTVLGIVVETGNGETPAAIGQVVTVLLFGPCTGFSGATIGSLAYLSNTAGATDTAAGAFTRIVGRFTSATDLFVFPAMTDAASA